MSTFLKAELYKLGNKKSSYLLPFLIGILVFCVVGFVSKDSINVSLILNNLSIVTIAGCAAVILLLTNLSDDFSFGTLKNYSMADYNVNNILSWKVVVQIIHAIFLFLFFFTVFLTSIYCVSTGEGYSTSLYIEAIIKIILSIPCYIMAILLMDLIFLKTKQTFLTIVIYYYGFIQVIFLLLLMGAACENKMVRFLIMPMQLGYLYNNELTFHTGVYTLLSEMVYVAVMLLLYHATAKKVADRMMGGCE